jgi:hypothetical protein
MNSLEYYQNNKEVCDVWSKREYHKPNTRLEWGETSNTYRNLEGKHLGKHPLGRSRGR